MDQEAFQNVQAFVRFFRREGLRELIVEEGEFKLRLRRAAASGGRRIADPPTRRTAPPARVDRGRGARTVAVRSPLIGVFYRAPTPDAAPFVEIGDTVSEGQTVCIVEAMKVFNEIRAEWRGRVVAIPAENGALVQAGEPLVVLEFVTAEAAEER